MSRRGENIYKRKDGRWEGRYIKGRKTDGRIKYGYVYARSYQETREKLLEMRVKYQALINMNGSSQRLFSDWANEWLNERKNNVKLSTFSSYHYKMSHYILPFLGNCSMNEFTEELIEQFVHWLKEQNRCPSTIHVILSILKSCLAKAVLKGELKQNPCRTIKIEWTARKPKSLTKFEQMQLEKVAQKYFYSYGFSVLLSLRTGLRIGEVAALKWENVDLREGFIYVKHTLQRVYNNDHKTTLLLGDPKSTTSVRKIPISSKLKKWFLHHKQKNNNNIFVFENQQKPCEPRLLTKYFHMIRNHAKLSHVCFHQLRHTFATRCLEAKADVMSVSTLLGHASTKMTLDIYADSLMEQRIQAIDLMDNDI